MPTTFTASIQKILCTPQPVPSSEIAARSYPALEAISDARNGAAQREPVIFCHHQHASEFDIGKSEVVGLRGDPDQAHAAELARRGT
jgi:hypothetical protein